MTRLLLTLLLTSALVACGERSSQQATSSEPEPPAQQQQTAVEPEPATVEQTTPEAAIEPQPTPSPATPATEAAVEPQQSAEVEQTTPATEAAVVPQPTPSPATPAVEAERERRLDEIEASWEAESSTTPEPAATAEPVAGERARRPDRGPTDAEISQAYSFNKQLDSVHFGIENCLKISADFPNLTPESPSYLRDGKAVCDKLAARLAELAAELELVNIPELNFGGGNE